MSKAETQCECMDGPNEPGPTCLYCAGTGIYVSDERLAELVERYTYLVDNAGIGRRDFNKSDRQHVAIFKALLIARADQAENVAANIGRHLTADVSVLASDNNSDYLRLVVEPKHGNRREYRISIGAADVLFHELAGMADLEPSP